MTDRKPRPPRDDDDRRKDRRTDDDRVLDDRAVDDRGVLKDRVLDDGGVLDGGVIDDILDDGVIFPQQDRPPLPQLIEQDAEPLVPSPDPELDQPLDPAISTESPLLLLPIRIETRYSEDRFRLRIRIYPDQVHVDTGTSPTLSELEHARTFWRMRAHDRNDESQTFRWLVDRVGSRRAGYLARLTRPRKTARGSATADVPVQTAEAPARVRLMPHHFVAIGWHKDREVFRVTGADIPEELVASPDPAGVGIKLDGSGLRTDPAMAWMFDYATAEKSGMAITVDLTGAAEDAAKEVTTLLVLGVASVDAKVGAQALADLLDAHQRAGDLAFVQQGTPTNNTDTVAAGYTRHERELADLEGRELADTDREGLVYDNAECFATALGLADAGPLRHLAFGTDDEVVRSRAMRAVLFEATLGTFVREALPVPGGGTLTTELLPALREWFVDEVTGGAPIPSIRVRNQPYGILPIAAPSAAAPASPTGLQVAAAVDVLRNEWRFAAQGVVRLDHDAIDVGGSYRTSDIGTVLAGEPHPTEFAGREAEEFEFADSPGGLINVAGLTIIGADGEVEWIEWQNGYRGEWDEGLERLREETPHVYEELELFLGQYSDAVDIDGQLARWLALRDHIDVLSRPQVIDDGTASWSWLHLPEAVAALPVIDDQLTQLWAHERRQRPLRWLGVDPYAGVLGEDNTQLLVTRFDWSATRVDRPVVEPPDAPVERQAATYLDALHRHRSRAPLPGVGLPYIVPPDAPLLHQLIGQTVNRLRNVDLPSLLTLASVDPALLEWHTRETLGLGTHRLDAWATSLVTRQLKELRYPGGVPDFGTSGPAPARRTGVHVGAFGWVTHLRPRDGDANQGFIHTPSMTHAATAAILRSAWSSRGSGTTLAPAAVDIQSARMRIAEWLLDGVRNGQPLGELLGYRLERYLHTIHLDALIAPLRIAVTAGQNPPEPSADDPVDGLDAIELWRAGTLYDAWPVDDHALPTDAHKAAIAFALGLLELAFDATDDAELFEATHQLVSGNLDRAAAVIRSMGDVDMAPPELIAQRTPPSGPTIDHRVMVLIDAEAEPDDSWAAGLRGALAPQLEAWVATLLPEPSDVGFRVGAAGARLDMVDISALDAIALAGDDPQTVGPALRELIRIADPDRDVTVIDATDPAGASVSLAELQLLAIELRRLIEASRPVDERDLRPGDVADPAAPPTEPGAASEVFATVRDRLATASAAPDSAGAELARFGIVAPSDDSATIGELAAARLQSVDDAAANGEAAADLVAITLGRGLPLLSPISGGVDAVQLGTTIADAAAIDRWIDLVAPVRPGVGRLVTAQLFAELLDPVRSPSFVTGQLPLHPGDRWAATSAPLPSTGGRVVVTATNFGDVDTTSADPLVGLVVDRWSELVPAADQITGVAVHHDAPSNRPPQTWLLATPPTEKWTINELAATVLDALEWTQLRAVAVEDLGDFGHAIPTVMVPNDLLTDPIEEPAS